MSRDRDRHERVVDVPLALVNAARPPYAEIRAWFADDAARHWAAYVAGVFAVLVGDHDITFAQGAIVTIDSDVPEGKGVSSSAALEVATMTAVRRRARPTPLTHPTNPTNPSCPGTRSANAPKTSSSGRPVA